MPANFKTRQNVKILYTIDTRIDQDYIFKQFPLLDILEIHQKFMISNDSQENESHGTEVVRIALDALGKTNSSVIVDNCVAFLTSGTGYAHNVAKCLKRIKTRHCKLFKKYQNLTAIVNLSFAFPALESLDYVVSSLLDFRCSVLIGAFRQTRHSIPIVIAAGNAGKDACNFSPGRISKHRYPSVYTVGSTHSTSNVGPCVTTLESGHGSAKWSSGSSFSAARLSGKLLMKS